MDATRRLYWTLLIASYLAATVTFVISNSILFWGSAGYGPITRIAGPIGVPAFLAWVVLTAIILIRYKDERWRVLIGAPFALWTPLRLLFYFVSVMLSQVQA